MREIKLFSIKWKKKYLQKKPDDHVMDTELWVFRPLASLVDLREALADSNRKPQDYLSVLHRQDVFKWYQHAYLQALYLSRVLNVYENKKKSWYWTRFSVIFSPVILLQFTTTLFFIFQIDLKLLCVIGLFQQKMENINMFKLNI